MLLLLTVNFCFTLGDGALVAWILLTVNSDFSPNATTKQLSSDANTSHPVMVKVDSPAKTAGFVMGLDSLDVTESTKTIFWLG